MQMDPANSSSRVRRHHNNGCLVPSPHDLAVKDTELADQVVVDYMVALARYFGFPSRYLPIRIDGRKCQYDAALAAAGSFSTCVIQWTHHWEYGWQRAGATAHLGMNGAVGLADR